MIRLSGPRWLAVQPRLVCIVLLIGCVAPSPVPEECPRAFETAEPLDSVPLERIMGTYEVDMVPTSYGLTRMGAPARLILAPPESLRLYFPNEYRPPAGGLTPVIAGLYRPDGAAGTSVVEYDAGILYMGCRNCLDGSPDRFRVEQVAATGFWGHWDNPQTGIWRIVDTAGRPLPSPSGIYCAVRDDSARWSLAGADDRPEQG